MDCFKSLKTILEDNAWRDSRAYSVFFALANSLAICNAILGSAVARLGTDKARTEGRKVQDRYMYGRWRGIREINDPITP